MKQLEKIHESKILLFDIETAPNLAYVWGHWEQNVIDYERQWHILSVGYKWLGEKETKVISLRKYKGYKKNPHSDIHLIQDLWKLFNEADFIVGHNGDKFDIKKANTRFIYHGLAPLSGYKSIDTLKIARKYFAFNSNKLDDLGNTLGLGRKEKHMGFDTWLGCMNGDIEMWKIMEKYNKQDVDLLERVYKVFRGWHSTHPNVNIGTDNVSHCPNCGSNDIKMNGHRYSRTGEAQKFKCKNCGAESRGKYERVARPVTII